MNTQLIAKLLSKTSSNQMVVTHEVDLEQYTKLVVEETITLLKKGDPDFNNFSENLVRQHFGMR